MSVYQVRTFAEILATIREEMQFSSSDTTKLNRIKRDVNAIMTEIAAEKNWWWLNGNVSVQLPAYISTGTVTLTAGQSDVTFSTGPGQDVTGYCFAADGYQEIYRIESHVAGDTAAKLDALYNGTSTTTGTFKLWRERIPLPTDCKETLSVYHDHYSVNLDAKGLQEFRRLVALNPRSEGKPCYYYTGDFFDPRQTSAITSLPAVSTRASAGTIKTLKFASGLPSSITTANTAGDPIRLRISGAGSPSYNGDVLVAGVSTTSVANDTILYIGKGELQESSTSDSAISVTQLDQETEYDRYRELYLYPCLNNTRTTIHVDYIKQVLPLSNDDDEPVIPIEDRMVLVYGALSRAWSRDRNPDEAARNLGMYRNKLAKMAGKFQDSQEAPRFQPSREYLRTKRNNSNRSGMNVWAPAGGSGGSSSPVITGTANSAAIFGTSGELAASPTVSSTELSYLDGVTSAIQTQIDAKAPTASPTFTGTVTAPTIVGDLTGNVTGNVSGSSGSCTGNAATVTTNANLTGPITSVGNATSIASQTGTGTKFVVDNTPTLVTPVIGAATGTSLSVSGQLTSTVATGTAPLVVSSTTQVANLKAATAGNADTVTTNANLTGDVTSVGNSTTLTNAPVIAKVLTGYSSGAGTVSATDSILQAIQKLNGNDATNANLTGDITSVGNATTYSATLGATKGGTGLTTYTTGDVPYASATNTLNKLAIGTSGQFLKVSSGIPSWGPGASGINYLSSNPDAEADTAGWATYFDAAGTTPVDATAGSPTVTWTRSTSSPLRGTGSFLFTKDAANRQGEGVSFAITLDSADQAKPICISFDYAIASGTYADGDLTVYLYDVTNSTVIQPTPYKILSATAGLSQKWIGYFQTSAASTSYRLAIHTASTSASAYTVKFDNWTVGPTYQSYGAVEGDWTAYTPTITGMGSATNISFWYKRIGDSLFVKGFYTEGTVTAALTTYTLPTGVTVDSTKYNANASNAAGPKVGEFVSGVASQSGPMVLATTTSTTLVYAGAVYGGTNPLIPTNASTNFSGTKSHSVEFKIAVSGWSSNVQVSSDADTRVVAFSTYRSAALSALAPNNSAVQIVYDTVVTDTHGAYGTGTGKFTAPVPGLYEFTARLRIAGTNVLNNQYYIEFTKNAGSSVLFVGQQVLAATSTQFDVIAASPPVQLSAGDTVEVYLVGLGNNSVNTLTASVGQTITYFGGKRLSGPAQIAASESVSARYTDAAGQNIVTDTIVQFGTKDWDTHNAVTTGASWKFTAPMAGKYTINTGFSTAAATAAAITNIVGYRLSKNAAAASTYVAFTLAITTSSMGKHAQGSTDVNLVAGDTISLLGVNSTGQTHSIGVSAGDNNFIEIKRTGN